MFLAGGEKLLSSIFAIYYSQEKEINFFFNVFKAIFNTPFSFWGYKSKVNYTACRPTWACILFFKCNLSKTVCSSVSSFMLYDLVLYFALYNICSVFVQLQCFNLICQISRVCCWCAGCLQKIRGSLFCNLCCQVRRRALLLLFLLSSPFISFILYPLYKCWTYKYIISGSFSC